jgi:hypothetical protein
VMRGMCTGLHKVVKRRPVTCKVTRLGFIARANPRCDWKAVIFLSISFGGRRLSEGFRRLAGCGAINKLSDDWNTGMILRLGRSNLHFP